MPLEIGGRVDVYDIHQQFKHVAWIVSFSAKLIVARDAEGRHRAYHRWFGDDRFVYSDYGGEDDGDYLGFPPEIASF